MTEQRVDDAKRYFNDLRGETELSQRSLLLPGPAGRNGTRLPASDALVRARHRRHARRRSAAAHGAHPLRRAERPRRRCAAPARLRRGEPALQHPTCSSLKRSCCCRWSSPRKRCASSTKRWRRRPTIPRCTPRTRSSTSSARRVSSSAARSTKPRALLNEGLARYPDNTSLRYSLALLYEDQSRNRKALDVLESLAEEHPDDAAILNAYGYLLTDRVQSPRRSSRLHRARARVEPRQPRDHRQHGLGALQARRLLVPRATTSNAPTGWSRTPRSRRTSSTCAGSSASATVRASCYVNRSTPIPTAVICKRSTSDSRHDLALHPGAASRGARRRLRLVTRRHRRAQPRGTARNPGIGRRMGDARPDDGRHGRSRFPRQLQLAAGSRRPGARGARPARATRCCRWRASPTRCW